MPLQATDDNSTPAAFLLRASSVSQALPANARLRMQLFADLTSKHVPSTVDPATGELVSTNTQVVLFTNYGPVGPTTEAVSSPPAQALYFQLTSPLGPQLVGRPLQDVV